MRRSLVEDVGGFSEELVSGVDTEFFYRVRTRGFRFVMPAGIHVEHPAPDNIRSLWRKFTWYGFGYGQETQKDPERELGVRLPSATARALFLLAATLWIAPSILVPYSPGNPSWRLGFRPLKALSTYAVALGYVRAWRAGMDS
jgi:GT2 family glycosyltransferase